MVIWIGQIARHSAILQAGCAMRTANRWGVFVSFLGEGGGGEDFKLSDGSLNIFSINPKRFSPNSSHHLCARDECCCSVLQPGAEGLHALVSLRAARRQRGRAHGTASTARWPRGDPSSCHGQATALASCSTGTWDLLPIKCMMLMKSFQFPLLLTFIPTARHRSAFRRRTRGSPGPESSPRSTGEGTHLEGDCLRNASKSSPSLPPSCLPHHI